MYIYLFNRDISFFFLLQIRYWWNTDITCVCFSGNSPIMSCLLIFKISSAKTKWILDKFKNVSDCDIFHTYLKYNGESDEVMLAMSDIFHFFFSSQRAMEKWQRKITIYVFMCIRWHLIPVSTPVRMRKFDFCHNGSFPLNFCLDFPFLLHRLRSGQSIYPLEILVKRCTFSQKRGSHGIFLCLENKRIRLKSKFVTALFP